MKKVSAITYTIVFIVVVGVLGMASFTKLIHYYDTGIIENNELNGAMHNLLGHKEMNGVVKLNNGYLLTPYDFVEEEKLQHNADNIISMKQYFDEREIVFLYVIPPYTSCKYDLQLPSGVSDYGNDNLDRFVKMLEEGGVEPLDLRETIHEDGIDHYDMMYKTDHHWTTKAGFYAYMKINEILMQKLDCEVEQEVMDFTNYNITTYPEWHLGSRGQRTGAFFAGIDDFDLILPAFETRISDNFEEGIFEDIVINKKALDKKEQTSRYTYDNVLGRSCEHFINYQALNNKRILVVTDSYGKAVNPFLILSYREVMTGEADYETIDEYNPDAVVILHYINNIMKDEGYDNCVRME